MRNSKDGAYGRTDGTDGQGDSYIAPTTGDESLLMNHTYELSKPY